MCTGQIFEKPVDRIGPIAYNNERKRQRRLPNSIWLRFCLFYFPNISLDSTMVSSEGADMLSLFTVVFITF